MALNRNQVVKPVKKLRKLVKSMDRRAGPRKIHSLRSNSRRLEAMVDAFRLDGDGVQSSLLSDLGRCRKRAGKVRDMDVLTAFASHIHSRDEEECLVQLLEHLGTKRRKYAQKLSSELRRVRHGFHEGDDVLVARRRFVVRRLGRRLERRERRLAGG